MKTSWIFVVLPLKEAHGCGSALQMNFSDIPSEFRNIDQTLFQNKQDFDEIIQREGFDIVYNSCILGNNSWSNPLESNDDCKSYSDEFVSLFCINSDKAQLNDTNIINEISYECGEDGEEDDEESDDDEQELHPENSEDNVISVSLSDVIKDETTENYPTSISKTRDDDFFVYETLIQNISNQSHNADLFEITEDIQCSNNDETSSANVIIEPSNHEETIEIISSSTPEYVTQFPSIKTHQLKNSSKRLNNSIINSANANIDYTIRKLELIKAVLPKIASKTTIDSLVKLREKVDKIYCDMEIDDVDRDPVLKKRRKVS